MNTLHYNSQTQTLQVSYCIWLWARYCTLWAKDARGGFAVSMPCIAACEYFISLFSKNKRCWIKKKTDGIAHDSASSSWVAAVLLFRHMLWLCLLCVSFIYPSLSIPPTFSLATYLGFWLTCLGRAAFDAEKVSLEAVAKQLATVGLWVKSEARKTEMMCMCVNVCEAESGHHNMSLSSHTPNTLKISPFLLFDDNV